MNYFLNFDYSTKKKMTKKFRQHFDYNEVVHAERTRNFDHNPILVL